MPTILLKKSDTPGSVPGTANLTNLAGGVEVAVNTADKRVYSMTSASAVIELGTNPSSLTCSDVSATVLRAGSATITNLIATSASITTLTNNPTFSGGTANGVLFLNGSKVATSGSVLSFDGTNVSLGASVTSATWGRFLGIQANYPGIVFDSIVGGGKKWSIGADAATLLFRNETDAASGMALTSTGLGIGTSSPGYKVDASGQVRALEGGTGSGDGGLIGSTASADGNAGVLFQTNATSRWNLATIGTNGANLRFYNYALASTVATFDSSGNVGIGTSSPSTYTIAPNLVVASSGFSGMTIRSASNNYGGVFFADGTTGDEQYRGFIQYNHTYAGVSDYMFFGTAGAIKMTLTDSGNLGIGTTSPDGPLQVSFANAETSQFNSGAAVAYLTNTNTTNNNWAQIFWTDSDGGAAAAAFGAQYTDHTNDYAALSFSTRGTSGLGERARITSGGRVGINATVPGARLSVYGEGTTTSTYSLEAANSSGNTRFIVTDGGESNFYKSDNGLSVRITADGELLVGTTTPAGYRFRVYDGVSQFTQATSATDCADFWNRATTGDNKFVAFYTETAATPRGSITYNRTAGLVAYNTTSDYRAKDILGPVQNSGATIDALKVYEGQMKGATQSRPMLVAHEAQEHAPYAVTGEKDAVNEDGTPKYQQMDVSALVPLLLAEIQSLRARVAQLESK